MKKILYALTGLSLFGMTACDNHNRLATDITGTWSGVPERIVDNNVINATILETYDFVKPSASTPGGDIMVSALVCVTSLASGSDTATILPYSMTASGTASITGSWEVISDDEISFNWDANTFKVQVDPEAIVVSVVGESGVPEAKIDSMKPVLAKVLEEQIKHAVSVKFMAVQKMDDIKVKKGIVLEYEINDIDYTMHRQNTN